MSCCVRCPKSGALVCSTDHCGLCWDEQEALDGKPSERLWEDDDEQVSVR